ncbi:nuclear transport factor 2 family protein [Mucilaginibacter sp. RS28]|uniref:Nuclear transport factor 2 family protein n=1 Tax=Mucilaginibacter straminoryzae TaxID=2932774 RepID=A0A9X1X683_9SPHI|nr:nuclear transport factor 2 family protein [Mucilaginibacter straminoryzae]MCJ8210403.1 nuclear transport factor 2 family protein [Mucilaginibacter straminoryzae]
MKKFILPFLLLISSIAFGQDREQILKVLHTQQQAWNKGNIDEFMKGYWKSDSLMFIGSGGPKYGWQTTADNYKKHYPDKSAMGELSFNILQVKLLDKTNAFVLGGWKLKREKDQPGGYFTLLFRKINGEWKIVVDHTS